jgi:hypothetical protein
MIVKGLLLELDRFIKQNDYWFENKFGIDAFIGVLMIMLKIQDDTLPQYKGKNLK